MSAFDDGQPPAVAEPAVPPPLSAAEIAAQIEDARTHAHVEGWAAGHHDGFAAGQPEGLATGHATGLAEGHAKGYEEGLQAGRAEANAERLHLRKLLDKSAQQIGAIEQQLGDALIDLALDIARQVVRRELTQNTAVICSVVDEIMHALPAHSHSLKIWLHPDDVALIETYLGAEHPQAGWRLLVDDTVLRGGCRAETPFGAIDATVQTRWQRVAASLARDNAWDTRT
jgi:flagellar assembly protein FliH